MHVHVRPSENVASQLSNQRSANEKRAREESSCKVRGVSTLRLGVVLARSKSSSGNISAEISALLCSAEIDAFTLPS